MLCNEDELLNCRERDSLALLDLYNATDGPNWIIPWDTLTPIDTWFGITLNDLGCVIFLDMPRNELNGEIPLSIGDISELIRISLWENNLIGELPVSIGSLFNLANLNVFSNDLEGELPNELYTLTNLSTVSISGNSFEGEIPEDLEQLINLEILSISQNNFSGTFDFDLSESLNLRVLNISSNSFEGLLPVVPSSIQSFRAEDNRFSGCFPIRYKDICYLTTESVFVVTPECETLEGCQYDFRNNEALPWGGDFERFCNGEEQIGSHCDDGNPETENDQITEDCECSGQINQTDCNEIPEIGIASRDVNCTSEETSFTSVGADSTSFDILWEFGDGNTSNETSPSHVYEVGGIYEVKFTISSPTGCSKLLTLQTEVTANPIASFLIDDKLSVDSSIIFSNNSINSTQFQWDFGDSQNSTETNPVHTFSDPGFYDIQLIATDDIGFCSDTINKRIEIKAIEINPLDNLIFSNAFTPDNGGSNNVLRFSDDEVIDNSELWIYNRWGDEIYHKKNYTNDWDGGGYPGGVYFYALKIGDTVIKKTLTILR